MKQLENENKYYRFLCEDLTKRCNSLSNKNACLRVKIEQYGEAMSRMELDFKSYSLLFEGVEKEVFQAKLLNTETLKRVKILEKNRNDEVSLRGGYETENHVGWFQDGGSVFGD